MRLKNKPSRFAASSVKTKISIGFAAVLLLHVSIAVTGHYGLSASDDKLARFDSLAEEARELADFQRDIDDLARRVLLFTQTGHESQARRASDLYSSIRSRLPDLDASGSETTATADEIATYLDRHEELFEAIVTDRNRRRTLIEDSLLPAVELALLHIDDMASLNQGGQATHILSIKNEVLAAEVSALSFLHAPDSQHVRATKLHLADARGQIEALPIASSSRALLTSSLDHFESSFVQMVQATRGYLHLVNVVMAGEAAEFDRSVIEYRDRISAESGELAEEMLIGSRDFQYANTVFSIVTILLGIFAAVWIGRQIGGPLNALTFAFDQLARGERDVAIPGLNRSDDIGQLARSAQLFRDQIHESTARLELAQQASMTGTWDWDIPRGRVTANVAYFEMIDEPHQSEITALYFFERIHEEDRLRVQATVEACHRGAGEPFDIELRMQTRDGGYRWIRSVGAVTDRDSDGLAVRMIGYHLDIQDAKDALALANAANQAKSDFLANMSHEIRTPMTAILGFVELLDDESEIGGDPEQHAAAVRTIRSNANHLLTVLDDVLDVSKIEAGHMAVESIETEPVRIVEEVASLLKQRAREKNVDLNIRYESPIPGQILTDPTRLRQILLNLVGNAIKFTEFGSVTLGVGCLVDREQLRISITDTGIGMTEDQRRAIERFEAFNQADSSMSRKFGGSGLGLRISNTLAHLLGGNIAVRSEAGVGSTFELTIATGAIASADLLHPQEPARGERLDGSSSHAEPDSDREVKPLAGVHVLLAEDGPDNQRLIAFHLKKAGASVTICDNGLIAVQTMNQLASKDRPDLILMDMQMPELDGYEATRRLRQDGFELPVIALTAHAMDGNRELCLEAGCDDYVTKPIDRLAFIETCRRWAESGDDVDANRAA